MTKNPAETDYRKQGGPVPLFSWGGLLSPVFLALVVIVMSISLVVPEHVAQNDPMLSEFSMNVRATLVSVISFADINAHAQSTAFPHTALLSHACMWTALAILFLHNTVAALVNWGHWKRWLETINPKGRTDPSRLIRNHKAGLVIVIAGPVIFSMIPGSTSTVGNADLSSRVFFSLLTGCILLMWQGLLHGYLPKTATWWMEATQRKGK